MNPLRIVLLAAAGVIVGVGVVLAVTGTNPLDLFRPARMAGTPTQEPRAPAAGEQPAEPAAKISSAPAGDVVPPAFGVVRVEPDGSLVVAGTAASSSTVELMTGSRSLGRAQAQPNGDFAIVLDEPLEPGNYQLVLRATSPDGTAAASPETAVVSVPETTSGQVLALVEKPGEPSRLITKPEPETPKQQPAGQTEVTAGQPASDAQAEGARAPADADQSSATPPQEQAGPQRTADEQEASSASGSAETAADEPAPTVAPEREAATGEPAATVETAEPADQSESQVATTRPRAQAETGQPRPEATVDEPKTDAEQQLAEAPAAGQEPVTQEKPTVLVEAVEIEGSSVFVAGVGTPGKRVRIYANAILLGETTVDAGGHFLVETERDLPVGDYIIRADMLEMNGADVIARAAVPFERQAGEAIAAVAPQAAEPQPGPTMPETASEAASAPATSVASEPAAAVSEEEKTAPVPQSGAGQQLAAVEPKTDRSDVRPEKASEAGDPVTVTAPKLEPAGGSVIIRRGDTLWHISRRVYGHGIRYTTIYLANQEQIADPDMIWPGQIFRVPGETPEGEPADMSDVNMPDEAETPGN